MAQSSVAGAGAEGAAAAAAAAATTHTTNSSIYEIKSIITSNSMNNITGEAQEHHMSITRASHE